MAKRDKGTFRTTKSGSIEYRIPYYDALGKRRIKSFTGDTKDECKDRAYEFLRLNEVKLIEIKPDSSIVDIAKQKVENDYVKNYCNEPGYDRKLHTLAILEKTHIGTIPIKDVTEGMLYDYLESVTTYSQSVLGKIFAMIASAFDMAYDKKVIESNFILTKQIKCPKSRKKSKVVRGMTEGEQKRFVETLEVHKVPYGRNTYKLQLLLELYTGMRMGEINALRPESINFKKGIIHIDATISRGLNCRNYFKGHPKTASSIRDVPMSEKAEMLLKQALDEMVDNPLGLIFYDHNKGDVVSTYQTDCFFRRICEKAKVPLTGQHSLRHTFATRCIEAGVPATVLQRWLGHTNIHITLDTYTDVFERMNTASVKKYDEYIEKIKEEMFEYAA